MVEAWEVSVGSDDLPQSGKGASTSNPYGIYSFRIGMNMELRQEKKAVNGDLLYQDLFETAAKY